MSWTPNRIIALVIGIMFLLLSIIGFIVAPTMTKGNVLGFDVDLVNNVVRLVVGLLALASVWTGWPRRFNQVFGIIYLLLFLAGLFYPALYFNNLLLGIMHASAMDHVLHFVVGLAAVIAGFSRSEETITTSDAV